MMSKYFNSLQDFDSDLQFGIRNKQINNKKNHIYTNQIIRQTNRDVQHQIISSKYSDCKKRCEVFDQMKRSYNSAKTVDTCFQSPNISYSMCSFYNSYQKYSNVEQEQESQQQAPNFILRNNTTDSYFGKNKKSGEKIHNKQEYFAHQVQHEKKYYKAQQKPRLHNKGQFTDFIDEVNQSIQKKDKSDPWNMSATL